MSYRLVNDRMHNAQQELRHGFQKDLSHLLDYWTRMLSLIDDCAVKMNRLFGPVVLIQVTCIFLRFLGSALPTWEVIQCSNTKLSLTYSIPTMIKYLAHLWIICYTADATVNEVSSSI